MHMQDYIIILYEVYSGLLTQIYSTNYFREEIRSETFKAFESYHKGIFSSKVYTTQEHNNLLYIVLNVYMYA